MKIKYNCLFVLFGIVLISILFSMLVLVVDEMSSSLVDELIFLFVLVVDVVMICKDLSGDFCLECLCDYQVIMMD